jgi:RHS repeat-associated protein
VITLSSLTSGNDLYSITGAHENNKNWQYSTTFAEEGKKKEVISYFDGSLYNRQSVTKTNSNEVVIVGETIYDFQGRPAVQVLPVPVVSMCDDSISSSSIKYYPKFNVDTTNAPYSGSNFDLDVSACSASANPMDTISGASRYYSGNNLLMNGQQSFIPHARRYPFSQVEYTPDNTGRIRSQSGVGKNYQLGSGHETKYLYGQPNQIQIDRLFGSEAGDASHYKKNVVIDANGQTSVTYMNQEGKTIATALAGITPPDGSGTKVDSLSYAAANQKEFGIDLFNNDANGVSKSNKIPASADRIEFSTQLLVSYASNYAFRYDLQVDTLADACLKENLCINCIYDFDIEVRDECGYDLAATAAGRALNGVTGKVDTTGGVTTFTMNCSGTSLHKDSALFEMLLNPGVYTVSKILSVNKDARDFYVKNYLDTANNTCVKSLSYFQAAELAKIDTMDCYNSCSACVAALGSKDDFVSLGKGTDVQYEYLLEQCTEPCRQQTLCKVTYDMLLSDVSIGGQYGKYNPATYYAGDQPLSVFNVNNTLNANLAAGNSNWKHPRMRVNGTLHELYLSSEGERTQVILTRDTVNFIPPVDDTTLVYTNPSTLELYTYPENLRDLSDFIPVWSAGFARSLVIYHPEYAYYVSCMDHGVVFPADTLSSDELDSLLFVTETFAQAVTNGFIDTAYHNSMIPALSKVTHIWSSTSALYDPFFTNSDFIYTKDANATTGSKTTILMLNGFQALRVDPATEMNNKITNFQLKGTTYYNMAEVSAMLARCGTNYGAAPSGACLDFGTDYYASPSSQQAVWNDSIRNLEWKFFKNFYYSEKQKIQFRRMEFYAKHLDDANSNYYGGSNACFGKSDYNPVLSKILIPTPGGFGWIGFPYSVFYDLSQPCSHYTWREYAGVTRRFYDPANSGLSTGDVSLQVAQQVYEQTGQCPRAFELQGFLNGMAQTHRLANAQYTSLDSVYEFTPDLYLAVNGGLNPPVYVPYQYSVTSTSGSIIAVSFINPSTSATQCTLTINTVGTAITDLDSIVGISQLLYDPAGMGSGAFNAVATYYRMDTLRSANITGNSCMNIKDCSFEPECTPSQFLVDMQALMSALQAEGKLQTSTTAISLAHDTAYNYFLSPAIKAALGSPNAHILFKTQSGPRYLFTDSLNPSVKIRVKVLSTSPTTGLSDITALVNAKTLGNNLATMQGVDSTGTVIMDLFMRFDLLTATDTTGIATGNCSLPDPIECRQKEHLVRKDLEKAIKAILTQKPLNSDISLIPFSPLLYSYELDSVLTTTYTSDTNAVTNYDTLIISNVDTASLCRIILTHKRSDGSQLNFPDIVNLKKLQGIGNADMAGNYYDFMAIATYTTGAGLVNDTIYGTSCLPIKNCNSCLPEEDEMTDGHYKDYAANDNFYFPQPHPAVCDTALVRTYIQSAVISYNSSSFSAMHSHTLSAALTATQVEQFCQCYLTYNDYLNVYQLLDSMYIDSVSMQSLPLPVSILDFGGCTDGSHCMDLYAQYLKTLRDYVFTFHGETTVVPLTEFYTPAEFTDKYCACAPKFINNMYAVMAGTIPPTTPYITSMDSACSRPLCTSTIDSTFSVPTYTVYTNPCVQQMKNLAAVNAANAYNQYIDSMTTDLADRYTTHCLAATERFGYNYTDKEYHFTLYYYDQAGNLIKTVPPEGVEPLDITDTGDVLEKRISYDRANGLQNVFTTHRMPTKYVYNSLNQLTYQTMPDHDNMDICEGDNPHGLDTGLVISSVQFVDASRGYLTGHAQVDSRRLRGYAYVTNDGGNNWKRLNGTVSGNIQKVQFDANDSSGFAISDNGMILKTVDGGNSWDLVTTLYQPSSGTRYTGQLTAMFMTASGGVVAGINDGTNPFMYYSSDSAKTFAPCTITGSATGDTITSIAYKAGVSTYTMIATARNGLSGKLFSSTDAINWSQITAFTANHHNKVQYVSPTLAIVTGEDGNLYKTTASLTYQQIPTGLYGNIIDVHFKNEKYGIALIDSVAGKAKIWKTADGGLSWEPFSAAGEYYNSFKYYDSTKIMAYGDTGALARIVMTLPGFGIIKPAKPNSDDFSTGDAIVMDDGSLLGMVASDESHKVHITYNLQQSSPVWVSAKADTLASPVPSTHAYFKKVLASVSSTSPSSHTLKAILLSTTGRLYSLTKSSASSTIVCDTVTITGSLSGKFFNDITCNSQVGTVDFYAYDTVNKALHRINFSGLTASGTAIGNSTSITGSVKSIDISNTTNEIMLVGRDGYVNYGADASLSTISWTDQTTTVKPCALNDIDMYGTNAACVGNDGSLWKINGSYSSWFLRNTSTAADLNALSVLNNTGGRGYLVGDAGKMIYMTSATSFNPVLTHVSPFITSDYTDVFVTSTNKLYATASDGKVVGMSNFTSMTPLMAAPASNVSANGVAIRTSGEAVVVGNNAGVYKYAGLSNVKVNALYPTPLIGASFYDANNGYLMDTMNVIRRTADGGNTWLVVLPQTGNYRLAALTAVTPNQCVLVGKSAYAAVANNTTLSSITVPSLSGTVNFLDVDFAPDGKYGIVTGSGTNALSLVPNGSNFTMTSLGTAGVSANLRAVHVFPNHSFITAGNKGKIYYYKGGTFYSQTAFTPPAGLLAANVVFNDIYFRDDYTGYLVGRASAAYKVLLNDSIAAAGTSANSLAWTSLCSDALNLGYTTNAQLNKMNFSTIAFAGPNRPMIVGGDSNIVINSVFTPGRYARLLREESNYYSTRFWYDKLGRMVLSQNTRQYNKYNPDTVGVRQAYSYTLYDALGRITEVGEKFENYGSGHAGFRSIFGSMVNDFYNLNTIDDDKLSDWIGGNGTRREVTHTYYDEQNILIPTVGTQENLRKRVASVSYEDVYDGVDSTYQHATHYTYDIHGNVNTLWQETPALLSIAQRFKRTDYDYDLISGKVNNVHYQDSAADGFHHHYEYDADNRITQVYTSADNGARWTGEQDDPLWTLDAKYFYYDHGPLARVEYGKAHVQGTDYAYTLQGWIKGVNSTVLSPGKDMGSDNMADSVNADFAKDVFSYSLNYYQGDYDAINYMRWNTASSRFEAYHHTSDLMDERNDLFNGNITAMATTISTPDTVAGKLITGQTSTALANAYRYDQLNRLAKSASFTNLDLTNNNWKNDNSTTAKLYRNAFKYDANGNITEQVKYDSLGVIMDSLVYRYEKVNGKLKRNRLYHVNEKAGSTTMSYDIEDQLTFISGLDSINVYNNYRYDEIGNLVHDSIEGIDTIKWTVYGKIKAIKRFSGSAKDNLYFDYDASGNRTAKHVYTSADVWKKSTYYVRDAQGNVMSTYMHQPVGMSMSYKLQEQHLYGSSRLGLNTPDLEMIGALSNLDTMKSWFGNKTYELSNHLGNVLTVISDRKIQLDGNSNTEVDGYVSDISSSTDYYAFGQSMPGRKFNSNQYRYGFNGKENDQETVSTGEGTQDYGMRIYNPALGKFLSVDPLTKKYAFYTPYQFAGNKPINCIDIDGLESFAVFDKGMNVMAIIPDLSQMQPKLSMKLVSASIYSKLTNADKAKYNYGILVKNVFTGGSYDEKLKKVTYGNTDQEKPIGNGDYNILENKGNTNPKHNDFFVLDPQDARPYDKIDDRPDEKNASGNYRDGFNLHPGKISHGCVTVCKEDPELSLDQRAEEWNTIYKAISENSGKEDVPDNRGNHKLIPFSTQVKYGTLRVIDSKTETKEEK